MKSVLYIKFIIIYIIFGFLSLFSAAIVSNGILETPLADHYASTIYKDATLLSNDYLYQYFDKKITVKDIHLQLEGMSGHLNASVWFVDKNGNMIAYSDTATDDMPPQSIADFNPTEFGNQKYNRSNYHDYFSSDVLTVIVPVTYDYAPQGYLLVHKSTDDIDNMLKIFTRTIFVVTLLIFLLSFIILLGFHFFVYRPLRVITDAAKRYASGDLEYRIPVKTEDEMGYLSASLNYMSEQIRDMEDYQKKFVANVSHDFRSPLTSIRGYVTAMADGTIPSELYSKYLNIILFETERLTDLTQDLLTLNEFDTQNLLLDKKTFDIHEAIKNVVASFEGTCTQKKITFELLLASKQLNVVADKRKIQQVLYNLCDNAIKFSDNDSIITIETTERGEKVYISVKDNGIGIPRNDLNKIWERFYKSDLSRGKDKKGTGLGLAIVKEAIQAHGENINVISTEGVGTEFIFSLPIT